MSLKDAWNWIKLNFFQAYSYTPSQVGIVSGLEAKIIESSLPETRLYTFPEAVSNVIDSSIQTISNVAGSVWRSVRKYIFFALVVLLLFFFIREIVVRRLGSV